MGQLNSRPRKEAHDARQAPAFRENLDLADAPGFPWLTLILVTVIIVALATFWFFNASR
jgi:hypothetical protein